MCCCLLAAVTVMAALPACSSDEEPTTDAGPPSARATAVAATSLGIDLSDQTRCDPIVPARCLLPFPNDHFTVGDPETPTGHRVAFDAESLPANRAGTHIDPSDLDRGDGFSPGSTMIVELEGVDLGRSAAPTLDDAGRSTDADSPVVVWDATTSTRVPVWAELDANVDAGEVPAMLIHPLRNFGDGHRIVVGLRSLRRTDGSELSVSPAFAAYRDGQRLTDTAFEARRPAMDAVFASLRDAGVPRASLQLAWDFTIASTADLTGRLLSIRDQAFAELGDASPHFHVDKVTDRPDPRVLRQVDGTFDVPLFLTNGGDPGGRLVLGADGLPRRQPGTFRAAFRCAIPPKAATDPARMSLYGHGLFGDVGEVESSLTRDMAATYDIVYCATNWYGMTEADVPNAASILGDLSGFGAIPDRLHQGLLSFLFLGRVMTGADGFGADPAFQVGGRSVLRSGELYFDGNSQGAILGGALTAVSTDVKRSVLAEAGMNYSLLLDRSVDFDDYLAIYRPAYPDRYDRMIGLQLIQLLWDRAETDGYANHITADPLPATPAHDVLLLGALGDHQVTEFALRVEAATLGAAARLPVAGAGRTVQRDPGVGLDPLDGTRRAGSAYFLWDTGSPPSPITNTPSRQGHDPHDDTPNIAEVQRLKDSFWHPDGSVIDPCAADVPCTAPVPAANADG